MVGGRCEHCNELKFCPECGQEIWAFRHVGVRSTKKGGSSIWHITEPCGHFVDDSKLKIKQSATSGKLAVYKGGPVWKDGYQWVNIFWGSYWNGQSWVDKINTATSDIELNQSYSGELKQYNVGTGSFLKGVIIPNDPTGTVSSKEIGDSIVTWIKDGTVPDLGTKGAYNVFLPPGVAASLGNQQSCSVFCDYHDTANGNNGPFFTCEPYPCSTGCNQCNSNAFDTLTQGLSEEMVELKTDMNPGTGWVIGNEEVCDYCDKNFVCNQISSGEFVNAWYSDKSGSCWHP